MIHAPITQIINASGSIPPGRRHIEFILSADFSGTINGAAFSGTASTGIPGVAVYALDAPPGDILSGIDYTVSAGAATLTTF